MFEMQSYNSYTPTDSGLYPWQQLIIDEIGFYEDFVGSQTMQALSDFNQNRCSMIQMSLRQGSGHTFLTTHIAKKYAATVVYFDVKHYNEMEILGDIRGGEDFGDQTQFVSVYELRHDIMLSSKSEWINENLNKLKSKFENQKVIVVDRAIEAKERFPEVIDFICQVAQNTAIILLG